GQSVEPLIARKYEYDQAGNLVSIDDKRNGVTRYSYDVIGRILSAVQPNLEERFAFDPAHNIMDATTAKVGRVEGNRVRVFEDKRYDYDAHGNVVEKLIGKHTKMRFEWNAAHQMVKSVVARNSSDAVQTVRYFYDPFGRRIGKRDAFGTTRFVWDGNRLQCETRGSHDRTYVYDTGTFVPLAQLDNLVRCDATVTHSSISYLQTDHLGTPREVTSSAGDVLWTAQYRTWGTVCSVVTASAPETLSSDDAVMALQPIRFQGQYFDEETSLHHNNFRYYDPDIGRFISVDPIGLAGGLNNFRYAPNPTTWIDPLGLKCEGHSAPQTDGNSANGKSSGRSFWPRQTTFEEITVYPRDDIFDPNLVTEWRAGGKIVTGSNVERMATGRAPIGTDGKPVNLHHMLQSNDSAIAELTQTFHQQNSKIIHINPNTIPSGVDRAAFDAWKSRYWANRSTEFIPK
ncbi:MAG: RHS repeat-associated core domain-containing protein, partial [Gammaproteobacteria bacterium]